MVFKDKGKLGSNLLNRQGIRCDKCGASFASNSAFIHRINGVWICENCYPDGFVYDDNVEFYPLHGVPDGCSTVTWCPFCERQAFVESIGSDWFYHDSLTGCGCTFVKIEYVGKTKKRGCYETDEK
jgi:hypothetical protein